MPDERRGAAFVCAAALVIPGGHEVVVHGEWRGTLVREAAGHQRLRLRPDLRAGGRDRTSAELAPEEKDADSHRGRALRLLLPHLARV